MRTVVKRAFGLVTLTVGFVMLVFGVGQRWFLPDQPFQIGPFFGGLLWGTLGFIYGRKWLFNLIDLDVFPVDPASPEIVEAARQAQASIGTLWFHLGQNRYECFVKFPVETQGGREHVWGVVHSREDDQVVVSLVNQPVAPLTNPAERFMVPTVDIEDWQVPISATEIRGGYSVAALAKLVKAKGYGLSRADRRKVEAFVDARPV